MSHRLTRLDLVLTEMDNSVNLITDWNGRQAEPAEYFSEFTNEGLHAGSIRRGRAYSKGEER